MYFKFILHVLEVLFVKCCYMINPTWVIFLINIFLLGWIHGYKTLGDTDGWLYTYWKISMYKWTHSVQTCVLQGPTDLYYSKLKCAHLYKLTICNLSFIDIWKWQEFKTTHNEISTFLVNCNIQGLHQAYFELFNQS